MIGILSHALRQNKFINNYPPAPGGFGGQVGVGYKSCIAVLGGNLKTTPLYDTNNQSNTNDNT